MPLLLLFLILLAACGTKGPEAVKPEAPKPEAVALSAEARRNAGIEVVTVSEQLDGGALE